MSIDPRQTARTDIWDTLHDNGDKPALPDMDTAGRSRLFGVLVVTGLVSAGYLGVGTAADRENAGRWDGQSGATTEMTGFEEFQAAMDWIIPGETPVLYRPNLSVDQAVQDDSLDVATDETVRLPQPAETEDATKERPVPPAISDTSKPVDEAALDASHATAWETGDPAVITSWFEENITGPRVPITGVYDAGGTITSQDQADELIGKHVTEDLTIDCDDCELHDFSVGPVLFQVVGGTATMRDVLIDTEGEAEYASYFGVKNDAQLTMHRVEIQNGQDGIKSFGRSVVAKYVYIHDVAESTGNLEGNKTHQDAWQHMGGDLAIDDSLLDYPDAVTSVLMLKPDSHDVGQVRINGTLFVGSKGKMLHVHDSDDNQIQDIDMRDNMLVGPSGESVASIWQVNDNIVDQLKDTQIITPGGPVALVDGAEIP